MVTVLELVVKPVFESNTVKVPPTVKPLIGKVYIELELLMVPFWTPETPLKIMSSAVRPEISGNKVRVSSVVVSVAEPLAVTIFK